LIHLQEKWCQPAAHYRFTPAGFRPRWKTHASAWLNYSSACSPTVSFISVAHLNQVYHCHRSCD
jgi:hypothetical protein